MYISDDYFDSDDFKEILAKYEQNEGANISFYLDADDLTDIADYYIFCGKESKAKEVIDTALEAFPGASGPLVYKAREALRKENLQAAIDFAEQMYDKEGVDYLYMQAEIQIAQDNIEEADEILADYYDKLGEEVKEDFILDVGELYLDYGVFDKAHHWLSLSENTDTIEYKELMGKALLGTGRLNESIDVLNELLDNNPYSKQYWNSLATAHMLNGNYAEAVDSSEYAIAIDPSDALSQLTKANSLYRMENYEEAIKYYQRYGELTKDVGMGEMNIGMCFINLGQLEEGIEHLKKAEKMTSEKSPQLPYVYQELAFAYGESGKYDLALKYIAMTEKLDEEDTDLMVLRGHILLQKGEVDKAQSVFWKAIRKSSCDPNCILRVIVSIYDNKYITTAYKLFHKLFATAPADFNEGYSYMALCCKDLHHVREFLKYLKLAVTYNPSEAGKVLGFMFPRELPATEYYEYIINLLNKK